MAQILQFPPDRTAEARRIALFGGSDRPVDFSQVARRATWGETAGDSPDAEIVYLDFIRAGSLSASPAQLAPISA